MQRLFHTTQLFTAGFFIIFFVWGALAGRLAAQERITYQDSVEVGEIRIEGNEEFSSGRLLALVTLKESPSGLRTWIYRTLGEAMPGAAEARYFDYETFTADSAALRQFYLNNGFFHAAVRCVYQIDEKRRECGVHFTITEGPPSNIDSIQYKNLKALSDSLRAVIFSAPLLRVGNRYNAADVDAERSRVITLLQNNGYPDARADTIVVERRHSTNNLTIMLPFIVGRRYRFGDISILQDSVKPNSLNISSKLVYDRLDFREGEVYSNMRREQGEVNLNRLRIFSSVRVDAFRQRDTSLTDIPIRITLQPKTSYEVSIGPLVNNQESRLNIGAGIEFNWLNIFGAAQIFSMNLQYLGNPITTSRFAWLHLQSYQGGFNVRFDQPYLVSNVTSGYWTIKYIFAQERDRFKVDAIQNIIGAKWLLSEQLTLGSEWTLEQSEFSRLDPSVSAQLFQNFGATSAINYRNSILTTSLDRDATNNFFNPTSGNGQRFVVEEAGVVTSLLDVLKLSTNFRNAQYVKLEATARWFADVANRKVHVIAVKLKSGAIFRYGVSDRDNIPVPFNRSYYAGGSNSVRGWSSKQLAVDSTKYDIGANSLVEASLEWRWNLFHERKFLGVDLEPLWLVTFLDAGNLWNEFALMNVKEVALAIGAGIRYNTPFGPVRIDFGVRLYDPKAVVNQWMTGRRFFKETMSDGVLHLGLAHAF